MRIAVISRVFSKAGGGAEAYSVNLVEQLAARHDIHVFSQQTNRPVPGVVYHPIVCLFVKPRWINQLLFAFSTWIKTRQGFDVVHSHENTWHGQIQTIHVRPIRVNLFDQRQGLALAMRWAKVVLSPRLLTYVILEGARFKARPGKVAVATSDTLKAQCERVYPHCKGLIPVVTPGVQLPSQQLGQSAARHLLGLPDQGKLILFVANDFERKGLDALLNVLCRLPIDTRLAVVGSSDSAARYAQMARSLGLTDRVHFLGSINGLSAAYRAADCLAHPTLEDSFGMVVLEAMAHSLPVVVSGPNYCGLAQMLKDDEQALLLADPTDEGGLYQAIQSLLTDPQRSMRLSMTALAFAKKHSWNEAARHCEALYASVAKVPHEAL